MTKQVDSVNQSSAPPEDDVLELMHAVMHQVRSQHLRADEDGTHPVGHMEGKVLGFFSRHPGATQSDLAAHSGRDKGQLARLIAGMKDKGLLQACADEKDRRVTRVYLTEAAQALHGQARRQRQQLARKAVTGFSAEQKRQLVQLLRLVQGNLGAAQECDAQPPGRSKP